MKIYRFYASWCSSEDCKKEYEKIYDLSNNSEYNNTFTIVSDDTYTHAIILNTAMPKLKIPKTNVIGFAYEPMHFLGLTQEFINYAKDNISVYYIGEKFNLPEPFKEHQGFLWRLSVKNYINNSLEKTKPMSIMVSHKNMADGHKYRHKLVQAILKTDLPIDIWGNGTKFYNKLKDDRVKTDFPWSEINKMYDSYKFHVTIENFSTPHYISEKILNPFICKTVPVYWGCKNIKQYVNNENVISLSTSTEEDLSKRLEEDIKLLTEIINNQDKYYNPIDINDPKLNKLLNMFDFLEKHFNQY
jgi:hypothetical protein